jgi:hypothetical protein
LYAIEHDVNLRVSTKPTINKSNIYIKADMFHPTSSAMESKHFKPFLRILFDKGSDDINKSLSSFPFQAKGFSLLDRMSQHQVKFFRTMPEFHGNPAKNSLDILSRVIKFDRILWHTTQKVSVFGGNEGVT